MRIALGENVPLANCGLGWCSVLSYNLTLDGAEQLQLVSPGAFPKSSMAKIII